ncbi:hypothetical protein DFH27DRAFT_545120 [Peziza echinospora]|nr:hypothetical protein DFH27DRAFT_545120 [Peziza echinospora]
MLSIRNLYMWHSKSTFHNPEDHTLDSRQIISEAPKVASAAWFCTTINNLFSLETLQGEYLNGSCTYLYFITGICIPLLFYWLSRKKSTVVRVKMGSSRIDPESLGDLLLKDVNQCNDSYEDVGNFLNDYHQGMGRATNGSQYISENEDLIRHNIIRLNDHPPIQALVFDNFTFPGNKYTEGTSTWSRAIQYQDSFPEHVSLAGSSSAGNSSTFSSYAPSNVGSHVGYGHTSGYSAPGHSFDGHSHSQSVYTESLHDQESYPVFFPDHHATCVSPKDLNMQQPFNDANMAPNGDEEVGRSLSFEHGERGYGSPMEPAMIIKGAGGGMDLPEDGAATAHVIEDYYMDDHDSDDSHTHGRTDGRLQNPMRRMSTTSVRKSIPDTKSQLKRRPSLQPLSTRTSGDMKSRGPTPAVKSNHITKRELPTKGHPKNLKGKTPLRPNASDARKHQTTLTERPFPCVFKFAGCSHGFGAKNEWKRHVYSQHVLLNVYRCDYNICKSDNSNSKKGTFNRRDLFAQHLRRMHLSPEGIPLPIDAVKENISNIHDHPHVDLSDIQDRCAHRLRTPPTRCICEVCNAMFEGENCWDDKMEHLGKHYETKDVTPPEFPFVDCDLIEWALAHNIIKAIGVANPQHNDNGAEFTLCNSPYSRTRGHDFRHQSISQAFAPRPDDQDTKNLGLRQY